MPTTLIRQAETHGFVIRIHKLILNYIKLTINLIHKRIYDLVLGDYQLPINCCTDNFVCM